MSDWKKVVTSGSSPTLTEITGSGLRFLNSPTTVTDTSLAILVQDGGNIKQYPQLSVAGVNTTYDGNSSTGIDQLGNGFIIDESNILHSAIPHVSGAIVHALWQDPLSDNIHAVRYLNNVYTAGAGIAINQIGSTDEYQVSSSATQAWTGVGTLDSGGINANTFPIAFTSSINAGTISSSGDATFTTANVSLNLAGEFQPQVNSTLVSASVIQAGPGASVQATTGLGIEGTFVFNALAFQEQIQLVYTGSHEFGGPGGTTSQTFTGDIEITAGATSSLGFFGDGSELTGLTTSNIDYFQLSTGSGISGSGAGGYDLSTAREFSLETTTQLGYINGLETAGLIVTANAVTESNIKSSVSTTTGVIEDKFATGAVTHSHFPNTIISDETTAVTDLANPSIELFRDPGAIEGSQLRAASLSYLNSHLVDSITAQLNNNVGSVTTMSVSPLEGGTQINGLYLTISNPSTTPSVGIAGTPSVNGTNWTASSAGADDQYLEFGYGGTGQGDLTASAASIFGTSFTDNAITIGGADGSGNFTDTVTIPGSLVVTNTPTMIQTDQFRIKDTLFHLGASDDSATGDYGFKFGAALTSSNSFIYDSAEDDMGRFGMAYALDASAAVINSTAAPTTKLNMIGVFSGSEIDAATAKANQHGNIRIDQDREIYFYI